MTLYGRLYPVTSGCYMAPEFNGGNSASNSKAPLSEACQLRTVAKIGRGHSPEMLRTGRQSFYML